ncbi:hypothetical protein [Burkholderia ubonensis]|uniref:hypothetical protein n=1 Tax=Burkholderia ubonensis TaxID=101571 RepID=UPI000B073321|nr:hypothetical protein [Burkholderia ubonensis]
MKKQIVAATLMASVVYLGISASGGSGLLRKAVEYGRVTGIIVAQLLPDISGQ